MEFKDIIKKLRIEKNYSQSELADELAISCSSVAMWETGKRFPSKELYEQIADLFNVDIDYLYGRTNIRQKVHFDPDGNAMVYNDFTTDELQLVIEYRNADAVQQEMIRRLLECNKKSDNCED